MATDNLSLSLLVSGQENPDVTHNEALTELDALVMPSVLTRATSTPPTIANGDRYLIPTGASGDWTSYVGYIALAVSGQWRYYAPQIGWVVWIEDEKLWLVYDGSAWKAYTGNAIISMLKSSDQTSITSFADVTWNTETKKDSGVFTHSANSASITLIEAGTYEIHADFEFSVTSGTNVWDQMRAKLLLDGSDITGSFASCNGSNSYAGKASCSINMTIVTASANQVLKCQVQRASGSDTVNLLSSGTRILISRK